MVRVKKTLNSSTENEHPLTSKTKYELKDILSKKYGGSNVTDLQVAFTVNTEFGTMLVHWDSNEGDYVGVPIEVTGGHHFLKEDGSY